MTAPAFRLTDKLAAMIQEPDRKIHRIELPEERTARVQAGEEADFQQAAINFLRSAHDIRQIDVVRKSKGNAVGIPDLRFSFKGQAVFFELKTCVGDTTDEQDKDHERRLWDGWKGGVMRSLPEIKAFLDNLENQGAADGQT